MVIFIVVFAIAAIAVWWRVITNDDKPKHSASCSSSQSASALTAHDVQVRVYNATTREGLAASVSKQLSGRGLDVITTANDPTSRKVTGVAEIRYGSAGSAQAKLLLSALPGATMVKDRRTDATVDVALGPHFHALASATAIDHAITALKASTTASAHC
jgi:LytR cell envelope-related transcriptional attenuator